MNHLKSRHMDIMQRFGTENILIMGDFNAGCTYISKKNLTKCELRSEEFHWLIPDNADTTVGKTDCAYDRYMILKFYFFK